MKIKWMALTVLSLGLCVQALAQVGGGRDMSAGVESSTSTDVSRSTSTDVFRSTGTDVFRSTDGVRGYDPAPDREAP